MSAEQDLADANVKISNLISEVTRFRDAAMGLNNIHPTITDGRQATDDGKYFSVPGSGAYMRLYRRQGTSAELISEFPDRAELTSVIDQLGPLLGRGVVGGSGDLMADRAYGLGNPSGPDFSADALGLKTQLGRFTAGTPDGANWYGLHFSRVLDAQSSQIAIRDGAANEAAFRGRSGSGVWRPWSKLYHNDNILGTVSQSSGVATGAIIERDSNDFFKWTKFADGTVILRHLIPAASYAFQQTASGIWETASINLPNFPFSVNNGASWVDIRGTNVTGVWGSLAGTATTSRAADSVRPLSRSDASAATIVATVTTIGDWI